MAGRVWTRRATWRALRQLHSQKASYSLFSVPHPETYCTSTVPLMRVSSGNRPRRFMHSTTVAALSCTSTTTSSNTTTNASPPDRFIPVTPASLLERLVMYEALSPAEVAATRDISRALAKVTTAHYQVLWSRLKELYHPFDPDKDTVVARNVRRRRNAEHQAEFIALFDLLLDRANFDRLTPERVAELLEPREALSGVRVRADLGEYECLHVWTRGSLGPLSGLELDRLSLRETAASLWQSAERALRGNNSMPDVVQRCITVCQTRDGHLHIRTFKEVDLNQLELLLPDVRVETARLDRVLLATTVSAGALASAWRLASGDYISGLGGTLLLGTGTAALIGYRLWAGVRNSRNAYLARHNRLLYFHNISSNRSSLALLVDRAVDEEVMEVLLGYHFLATARTPLSRDGLKVRVEEWLLRYLRVQLGYDVDDALTKLNRLGLLHTAAANNDAYGRTMYTVSPLEEARALLVTQNIPRILPPEANTHLQTKKKEEVEGG